MGNVNALAHRATATSMACLASAGLIMCILSGFNCSFVEINAQPGRSIRTPWGQDILGQDYAYVGIQCTESPFYDETDRMWALSQLFFYIALGCGAITTAIAWALSLCYAPKSWSWRTMSMMAAVTAVMGVPIFLIFEIQPCNMDINRQTCSLGVGSYFNIASVLLWVMLTLWSQCLNPPDWSKESDDVWKREGDRSDGINIQEITIPDSTSDLEAGPKDFNGELIVTSNDDGLAIWTMGKNGERHMPVENARLSGQGDCASIVSSISDGEKGGRNLERLNSQDERDRKANDSDIRKGAEIVIAALRDKTMALKENINSVPSCTPSEIPEVPKVNLTSACSPRLGDMKSKENRKTAQDRALFDSDNSDQSDEEPGIKLSVTCPDGSNKETNLQHLASCFVGEEFEARSMPEELDPLPGVAGNSSAVNRMVHDPYYSSEPPKALERRSKVSKKPKSARKSTRAPVESVQVPKSVQIAEDSVSGITPAVSVATAAGSGMTGVGKDPISILEDLARTN